MPQPHGGRIGQPAFVPTDEQRHKVRQLAKAFPPSGERYIARLLDISLDTLRKYFGGDLELGRAEMLAAVGAQFINRALDAEKVDGEGQKLAKGDLDAQKFVLARLAGWSTKVEHSGPGGGPVAVRTFDLSQLSPEAKAALLPVIDQLLVAAGEQTIEAEYTEIESEEAAGGDAP